MFLLGVKTGENNNHATNIIDGKQSKVRKDNPRVAAYGWEITHMNRTVAQGSQIINANSPQQAETLALLLGIKEGKKNQIKDLEV